MPKMKRKIKAFLFYLINYAILMVFIIGLRFAHGLEVSATYYIVISSVILFLLIVMAFIEPQHLEKIFPKNSTAALLFIFALRFMPLVKKKVVNIKQTQEMRGANFGRIGQFRNYACLLIPSIINVIRWANSISEGISVREGE